MSVIPLKKKEQDELFKNLVQTLVQALELKDPYTCGHSVRVAEYAVMMGEALQLNNWDLKKLELGALLHDIGKIGIPDAVLKKNGKLTTEEFEIMKQHPVKSAQICQRVALLKDVVPIVKHHHERIDGTGYPDGLRGEKIPLLTRVVFIVDAFDAMTSDRPYRDTFTHEQAYEELLRCAGTQFDAKLVPLFVKEHKKNKHRLKECRYAEYRRVKKKAIGQ